MNKDEWSVPENEVLSTIAASVREDSEAVLATIVSVEGSAYRRPGAKMLIDPSGNGVGSITAGCLEDEVRQLAADVLEGGEPLVETYDLMEDDDVWGLGVGCNGVIDVLLEPINESFKPAADAFASNEDVAVVTVLEAAIDGVTVGDRALVHPGQPPEVEGDLSETVVEAVAETAADLATRGKSKSLSVPVDDTSVTVFIDGIAASPELVILGTGHDVGPIVDLGNQNDFRVTVIGFRGGTDLDSKFPNADVTHSTRPAQIRAEHEFDEETYVVVMSHNFIDDRIAVAELLETAVPYVGLLGPRDRFEEMLEAFDDDERAIVESNLDRVYTPVGLDLGGGSPHQIATSIISEIMVVNNDRTPRHLKSREGPIHDRIDVDSGDEELETTEAD